MAVGLILLFVATAADAATAAIAIATAEAVAAAVKADFKLFAGCWDSIPRFCDRTQVCYQ